MNTTEATATAVWLHMTRCYPPGSPMRGTMVSERRWLGEQPLADPWTFIQNRLTDIADGRAEDITEAPP